MRVSTNNRFSINGEHYNEAQLKHYCNTLLKSPNAPDWEAAICIFILDFINESETISVGTSGSTAQSKNIILKKKHMIQSALNTAEALDLQPEQNALLCISANYIAGKMMIVRAMVTGMNLITRKPSSNPLKDLDLEIDFTAMVPMQIAHILKDQDSMFRLQKIDKLIIGGGMLDQRISTQLVPFPNAIFETYGMTETCSHIALKRINGNNPDRYLKAMPGVSISLDERDCLVIDAPTVADESIITNDIAALREGVEFEIVGRHDNVINSGGIKIIPEKVESKLSSIIRSEFIIASLPDPILGEKVILIIKEKEPDTQAGPSLKQQLKTSLPPFEQPKEIFYNVNFMYTHSGKVSRHRTVEKIQTGRQLN